MGNLFTLKDISTYRSELMGWAIVWIMMLHFTFTQIKPLGFLAQYGFAGVDIFMLVSGFGLFFSLEKNSHIIHFIKTISKNISHLLHFRDFCKHLIIPR